MARAAPDAATFGATIAEAYTTKVGSEEAAETALQVPVMLVSQKEWIALVSHCVR